LLLLFANIAYAAPDKKLYAKDLLRSSAKHLPNIMRAKQAIAKQQGELLSSQGAFDRSLDGSTDLRRGYYDGKSGGINFSQPFKQYNSRLYGGYRVSDGSYPSYDGGLNTQSGGEVAVGAVFSLLRNRNIDARRAALNNQELRLEEVKFSLLIEQLNAQLNALNAYLEWQAKGLEYIVRKDIWEIANKRQSALENEVAAGNKARIFLVENRQNMLKRKTNLRDVERMLNNAAQSLSFYYRDANGLPITPTSKQLPDEFMFDLSDNDISKNIKEVQIIAEELIKKRPDIKSLELAISRAKQDEALANNNMLPVLDVNAELSQDLGQQQLVREQTESKLKLNLSIPLQRRVAEGKIASAKATQRMLEHERSILTQQLTIELQRIFNDIKIGEEMVVITAEEMKIAKQLLKAEKSRFADGASDFFLLNIREETLAESRIRHVLAMQRYYLAISRFLATTMQTKLLMLSENRFTAIRKEKLEAAFLLEYVIVPQSSNTSNV
jgi:outer membrane protein TolC